MSILSFRLECDKPIKDIIRAALHNCDTCPHVHHCHTYKFHQDGSVQLVDMMGHPLVCCSEGTACTSKVCIFPLPSAVEILEKCVQSIKCLLSGKAD